MKQRSAHCPLKRNWPASAAIFASVVGLPAWAQVPPTPGPAANSSLSSQLDQARSQIAEQDRRLAEQERRIYLLEQRVLAIAQTGVPQARQDSLASSRDRLPDQPIVVGEAPAEEGRAPAVAVLDERGTVLTRQGQLIAEVAIDYSRSDRNRAVFRGVELLESILVGVFDVNESRQDLLTASATLRYGLSRRLEIGLRLPWVYRSDMSIIAPIAGSTNDDAARTIDSSVLGSSIGDVELTARYQLNDGGRSSPYLTANLQATLPTGRSSFDVRRDENGSALQVATGAGFVGLSPSITAILPSEPAVLFGTLGYTFNLPEEVATRIPPVEIDRVDPGDSINFTAGAGLALNDRTSLSFGYAHTWVLSTATWTRLLDERTGEPLDEVIEIRSRDLQVGRLLFGITQRFSPRLIISWSVEVGATQDASDVRTTLRIPFAF